MMCILLWGGGKTDCCRGNHWHNLAYNCNCTLIGLWEEGGGGGGGECVGNWHCSLPQQIRQMLLPPAPPLSFQLNFLFKD